ncbi:uncharacterized protein A1O9_11231 [Exophiala aquamarina CBS 119918]|uniref:Complex 1 LYR protein domain-containing protein n=1 Tax=Exophiala aquamarina CBS 119918 TaxID=1182545 RepID=A0A072NY84_9EURO|nr:uncharacterized protein A1O9_11231 [Exophiala aquamarina CBS 119918]KEF52814.1 hypothetical protein A1O9_11231 [Exophiala aquamarina CBS 119918]
MPRPFVAHKSHAHRLVCLSLYRALLKECTRFSASDGTGSSISHGTATTLQSLVRYRFRKDRKLASLAAIQKGLDAGNEHLSLLRDCVARSSDALERLGVVLRSVIEQAKEKAAIHARNDSFWQPPSKAKRNFMAQRERATRKDLHQSSPGNPAVFQRPKPLSEITWPRRKVPNYLITSGIPLLKYPGPQPILMNRVIRQKWKRNTKRQENLDLLEADRHLAATEDDWDGLMKEHGVDEDADEPNSTRRPFTRKLHAGASTAIPVAWQDAFYSAIFEIRAAHKEEELRNKAFGEKLYNVLREERDLRERERRAAKHERRMERKRAQLEGSVTLSAGIDEGAPPPGRVDETM